MTMDWITKKAKYFVIAMGVLVSVAMIFMGPPTDQGITTEREIGIINGKTIPLEPFRQELNFYQERERNRSGKSLSGLQLAQLRKQLFDYKVQEILLSELFQKYQLYASPGEMWDYLINNPDPAIQQDSAFQTAGSFDKSKYIAWLNQDQALNTPYIRNLERRMKVNILPSFQLSQILDAQYHATDLEMAYDKYIQDNKVKFAYYKISDENFSVAPSFATEEKIQEYYNTHPDSFYYSEEAIQLGYVSMSIVPSSEDSLAANSLIQDIEVELSEGANFEDLAISYSEDASSAENGGKLGGFQPKGAWVSAFGDVAFSLKKGEISKPVLTQFGYHIIQCNNVKGKGSKKQMDLSHILIRISPSPETIDSLTQIMESHHKKALNDGSSLQEYAKKTGLKYSESPIMQKWEFVPIDNQYIPGLHSFSFGERSSANAISQALQTEKKLYLFEKEKSFPKGRNLERSRETIASLIVSEERRRLAKESLAMEQGSIQKLSNKPISKLPKKLGKATMDTTGLVGAQSWVLGVGYDQLATYAILNQPKGAWGKVLEINDGVLVANVLKKEEKSLHLNLGGTASPLFKDKSQKTALLQQEWIQSLVQNAKITNNLDAIYQN